MGLRFGSLELSTPLVLAPMTKLTDLPFRYICRKMGAGAVCTEMVSAEGLVRGAPTTRQLMRSNGTDRPVIVQLFGSTPQVMAEAARICQEEGADGVDINMGCPVPKVVKIGAGAALLKDVGRAARIMEKVRKRISIPLTIKMRSGWSRGDMTFLDVAREAERCGVDAITLHPRARSETFAKPARWELIKKLVENTTLPVVGNGDIRSAQDVLTVFQLTGCSGVMIGRAAVGNPWIFTEALRAIGQGIEVQGNETTVRETVKLHIEAILSFYGPSKGLQVAKLHLVKYFRGMPGSSEMRRQLGTAKTWKEVESLVEIWMAQEKRVLV